MSTPEQDTNKQRVLICDDDRTHLLILKETLVAQGYEVAQAENGKTALKHFETFVPNIVLLDVKMPLLDGYEVCAKIRRHRHGQILPILMITGSDDTESIEKSFKAGATDFFPKPIKWPLVCHRIKYMLRAYEQQQKLITSQEQLKHIAYYDTLTELPNRRFFVEQLETTLAIASRNQVNVAVILIDLDDFKRINDTVGHSVGNQVLQEIALRLSQALRESDVVSRNSQELEKSKTRALARLGTDEFILMLYDCGEAEQVARIAKRALAAVSLPLDAIEYNVAITASIGISISSSDNASAEDLIKFAETAMYDAKHNGKNCSYIHSTSLSDYSLNRLKLEETMRNALATNSFELYYQPQLDLATSDIKGVEGLLRLRNSDNVMISPIEFIPVAEDTGLIVDIGYWVITEACQQIAKWEKAGRTPIKVSVNVSSKQLQQKTFCDTLAQIVQASGINPALLQLELTESIVMNNVDNNIVTLLKIKSLGLSISIDDFGTGYSSLSYLKRFPIDTLKIDRSFVVGLLSSKDNEERAIISAIHAMSKALNLYSVVEGIETKEQLETIKDIYQSDATLIQGFYYSKPLSAPDLDRFIRTNHLVLS